VAPTESDAQLEDFVNTHYAKVDGDVNTKVSLRSCREVDLLTGCMAQVDKIVGKGAPTEFIEQLEDMVNTHHEKVEVDVIRAYHFGARFIVEVRP